MIAICVIVCAWLLWEVYAFFKYKKRIKEVLREDGELSTMELCERGLGSISRLHNVLDSMEKNGDVVSRWGTSAIERGGYRNRLYRLPG